MIQFEKLGIFLSKWIAFLLVVIYFIQSALLVFLIYDKFELQKQISFQQDRIKELEEKLQVFQAIDDFQIGFTDDEVNQLTTVIYDESKKYKYDPMFVLAVILTESSFKKRQESEVGAKGLMQVIPYVGEDLAQRVQPVRMLRCVWCPPALRHHAAMAQQHHAVHGIDVLFGLLYEGQDGAGRYAL